MGIDEIIIVLTLLFSAGIACSFASNSDVKRECQKSYDEGYQKGYDDGYDKGYDRGYDKGYDRGYEEGYETGRWK